MFISKIKKVLDNVANREFFSIFVTIFICNAYCMFYVTKSNKYSIQTLFGSSPIRVLINISIAIILSQIFSRFKCKKLLVVIFSLFLSLYTFVFVLYKNIFGIFFKWTVLSILLEAGDVKSIGLEMIRPGYFLVFIALILSIMIELLKNKNTNKTKKSLLLISAFSFILYCVFTIEIINIRSMNERSIVNHLGVFSYVVNNTYELCEAKVSRLLPLDEENLDNFNNEYSKTSTNEMTGIFKNKNLILILCESFDDTAISEELTPTLYKLAINGFNFTNYYAPIFESHTNDSEFMTLTGMLPSMKYGNTFYTFSDNNYPNSLANILRCNNYTCNSYHSYKGTYYNRTKVHQNLGFNQLYDGYDLGVEVINLTYTDQDDKWFDLTIQDDGPFFSYVISLSGHGSYYEGREDIEEYLKIVENSSYSNYCDESKRYLASQMILDRAIEKMIITLEDKGIFDDTVIVLYADHYPYTIVSDECYNEICDKDDEIYKVPFIIYNSTTQGKQIDKLCWTADVYPTLTNLFGLDTSKYYKAGVDVFSNKDSVVIYPDGSYLSDDKTNGKKRANEIYKFSQDILLYDYYNVE